MLSKERGEAVKDDRHSSQEFAKNRRREITLTTILLRKRGRRDSPATKR